MIGGLDNIKIEDLEETTCRDCMSINCVCGKEEKEEEENDFTRRN